MVEQKRRARGTTTNPAKPGGGAAKGELSGFWSITAGIHLPDEPKFVSDRHLKQLLCLAGTENSLSLCGGLINDSEMATLLSA